MTNYSFSVDKSAHCLGVSRSKVLEMAQYGALDTVGSSSGNATRISISSVADNMQIAFEMAAMARCDDPYTHAR